jgi:hypothetical protein
MLATECALLCGEQHGLVRVQQRTQRRERLARAVGHHERLNMLRKELGDVASRCSKCGAELCGLG